MFSLFFPKSETKKKKTNCDTGKIYEQIRIWLNENMVVQNKFISLIEEPVNRSTIERLIVVFFRLLETKFKGDLSKIIESIGRNETTEPLISLEECKKRINTEMETLIQNIKTELEKYLIKLATPSQQLVYIKDETQKYLEALIKNQNIFKDSEEIYVTEDTNALSVVRVGGVLKRLKKRNKSRTTKKSKRKLLSHKRKKSSSRKGKKSSIRQ